MNLSKKCKTYQDVARLTIHSKKLCEDLITLGATPKKTHNLKFPNENIIPRQLLNHFIRGYFDGDGGVSSRIDTNDIKKDYLNFSITGHDEFIYPLKDELHRLNIDTAPRNRFNSIILCAGGLKQSLKFYNYIYTNSTLCIDRKRIKFLDFFNHKQKYIQKHYSEYIPIDWI